MASNQQLRIFYRRIIEQWGKAHSLRTICELTCRNFCESFNALHCQIIVASQSTWKILLEMNSQGISYQSPPCEIPDNNHFPIEHIIALTKNNQPHITRQHDVQRLWLPLERRDRIIGCLVVDIPLSDPLLDCQAFSTLTSLLASEIDTGFLTQSIQDEHWGRRSAERELEISQHKQKSLLDQLQALHDISFKLWRTHSMNEMLYTAVEEGKKQLKIDRMAIFISEKNNRMRGTYGTDLHGKTVDEHYFESDIPNQWFLAHTRSNKEYLAIENNTPLYHNLKQVGFGWSCYIALWDEDTPVGWIACDNLLTGTPLHDFHPHLLKQFGFILSQNIVRRQAEENLRNLNKELEQRVTERTAELELVNQKLESLSKLDPLTNIANRRVFDERIIEEWRRAERHQLPLSLLIMDVDNFKSYNDNYGHAAGDQCLKAIATTLEKLERRAGALFARYGGEEFVLLLPGQDTHAAQYSAKQALAEIQQLQLTRTKCANTDCNSTIVTISIGVSTVIPAAHRSHNELFKQADMALYEAKSQGRNRYFVI
ncbi:MAG: diguanylate cyclase [Photobacterium frigidiphilum]|uniref:sensor domain-containing diguanylate cyclase n=1 Tax=Photobacterium frigidiphilum TaxID=264736 RepID=UPI0030021A48